MAINQQTLEGNWDQIKGKLHERWGDLTDDELQYAHGSVEQLVGTIQERTGESRAAIENYLDEVSKNAGPALKRTADSIRQYAGEAAESVQHAAHQASEQMQSSMRHSQEMVRRRPFESILTCFGVGLVTGLVIGAMVRSR